MERKYCFKYHNKEVIMQQNKAFDDWLASTALGGANQSYIEELYESYLTDPQSVEESWRTTLILYQKPPHLNSPIHQCGIIFVV